jgi:hypothetical protein
MKPNPESLDETLIGWRIKPAVDPNFRPAVTARLAALRRERDWPSYLRAHSAVWTLAAVLALGAAAWTGHRAAQARNEANRDQLADSYVRRLDPRAMNEPQP